MTQLRKPGVTECWHCSSLSAGDRACEFHGCGLHGCFCDPPLSKAYSYGWNDALAKVSQLLLAGELSSPTPREVAEWVMTLQKPVPG
jgi:hypothetical protein